MNIDDIRKLSQGVLTTLAAATVLVFASGMWNSVLAEETKKDPHVDVFAEDNYPSASQCAGCHQKIYKEWAS